MAINVDFKVDVLGDEELVSKLKHLAGKDIDKAVRRAVTGTNRTTRKELKKSIGSRFGLKAGRIAQDIRPTRYQSGGHGFTIHTADKSITLRSYGGRMTRKGYSSMVIKGNRTITPRSFTINRNVQGLPFMRKGRARYPIVPLYGPSIYRITTRGKHSGPIKREVIDTSEKRFIVLLKKEMGAIIRGF